MTTGIMNYYLFYLLFTLLSFLLFRRKLQGNRNFSLAFAIAVFSGLTVPLLMQLAGMFFTFLILLLVFAFFAFRLRSLEESVEEEEAVEEGAAEEQGADSEVAALDEQTAVPETVLEEEQEVADFAEESASRVEEDAQHEIDKLLSQFLAEQNKSTEPHGLSDPSVNHIEDQEEEPSFSLEDEPLPFENIEEWKIEPTMNDDELSHMETDDIAKEGAAPLEAGFFEQESVLYIDTEEQISAGILLEKDPLVSEEQVAIYEDGDYFKHLSQVLEEEGIEQEHASNGQTKK